MAKFLSVQYGPNSQMTPFSDTQGQLDTEMYLLSEVFADDMFVGIMKDDRLCADPA